jgi:hypothetical protein
VTLTQLRSRLEQDLGESDNYLAEPIDRQLRTGIVDLLEMERRQLRPMGDARRGSPAPPPPSDRPTVRENLEALETDALVAQIEDRVGADLQFIRLNGAVVGG